MNNKSIRLAIVILVLISFTPVSVFALNVKLGSPFPEGTEWDNTLKRLAAEWSDITNGQVKLRIYPGGVAGDDGNMVRKMRFNQLDAAVLTSFGMKIIVPNSFVMTLPGMVETEEELDEILLNFAPRFDQDFVDQGFRVMSWSKTGWAYLFTNEADASVQNFQSKSLSVSSADEESIMTFKAIGFNVVPTQMNEIMVSLQSGMVDTFYTVPMLAAVYQWFSVSSYMMDLPISPVIGGLVISERTWSRIPERYHAELKASVANVVSDFFTESVSMNKEAMTVMADNGLEVLTPTDAEREEWFDVLQSGADLLIGDDSWIDQDVYDDYSDFLDLIKY